MASDDADILCPVCGAGVEIDGDCPGYGTPRSRGGTGVMVCFPPCGNAVRYSCTAPGCRWWYRDPPGVRGDVAAMGQPPARLLEHGFDIDIEFEEAGDGE